MKWRGLILLLLTQVAWASDGQGPELMSVKINLSDKPSLQRGARTFMNYCSGCHSLKYLRYNRMAHDLGLTTFGGEIDKPLLMNNLIFSEAQIHDPIRIAMPETDARQWFGVVPPDLSLETRVRGVDWVYTYLQSFYRDATRPYGANNWLVSGVSMPNVLAPLQGEQVAVKQKKTFDYGGKTQEKSVITHLLLLQAGTQTQHQFDQTLKDLVNFLAYAGEPIKTTRITMGWFVLFFLLILLIPAYWLKRSYWDKLK